MAGDVSKGPPHTERIDVERVLSRRDRGVTLLGRDAESGANWVIKEVHGPVREFPPADRRRAVWTRLVLPWGLEREDARTRIIRPFVEGTSLADIPEQTPLPLATCLTVAIDSLRALDAIHGLGLVHGAVKPVERDPRSGDGSRLVGGSEHGGAGQGGSGYLRLGTTLAIRIARGSRRFRRTRRPGLGPVFAWRGPLRVLDRDAAPRGRGRRRASPIDADRLADERPGSRDRRAAGHRRGPRSSPATRPARALLRRDRRPRRSPRDRTASPARRSRPTARRGAARRAYESHAAGTGRPGRRAERA